MRNQKVLGGRTVSLDLTATIHSSASNKCGACSHFHLPITDTEKVKLLTVVKAYAGKSCGMLALSGG